MRVEIQRKIRKSSKYFPHKFCVRFPIPKLLHRKQLRAPLPSASPKTKPADGTRKSLPPTCAAQQINCHADAHAPLRAPESLPDAHRPAAQKFRMAKPKLDAQFQKFPAPTKRGTTKSQCASVTLPRVPIAAALPLRALRATALLLASPKTSGAIAHTTQISPQGIRTARPPAELWAPNALHSRKEWELLTQTRAKLPSPSVG